MMPSTSRDSSSSSPSRNNNDPSSNTSTRSRSDKDEVRVSPLAVVGSESRWGKLVSLVNKRRDMHLDQLSLDIADPRRGKTLCTLSRIPPRTKTGSYSAVLDVGADPGIEATVWVDGCICPKDSSLVLEGGEKLEFGSPDEGFEAFEFRPVWVTDTHSVQYRNVTESLRQKILRPDDIKDSFDSFPYYLSENTKNALIAPAHMHLKRGRFFKYSLDLPALDSRILLLGPAGSETYQESLTKALAKCLSSGLLIIDSLLLPDESIKKDFSMDDRAHVIEEVFEVVCSESKISEQPGLILFLKEIEELLLANPGAYIDLKTKLQNLPEKVVVISSLTRKKPLAMKELVRLFPNTITIQLPQDEAMLLSFKKNLEEDIGTQTANSNIASLQSVLRQKGLEWDYLEPMYFRNKALTMEEVHQIVAWSLAYMDMHYLEDPANGSVVVSRESIRYGLDLHQSFQNEPSIMKMTLKDVVTENEFEERLLANVIAPADVGIRFNDIGALETVKEILKEVVMLPLQRPELFSKSELTKPCKGILLFGPPGTGKTMLAKAIATEAGANFINISMSSILSEIYGESEKYVKALFSLASKLAPCIIFVDEADSLWGRRGNQEHELTRRVKNEFMANWDGLGTKDKERVLVLAATNRPFDIDEAVIRRLPRRLMVNLPDAQNREKILTAILAKEALATDVNLETLANITTGYSGSDLKNLCVLAACYRIREILAKENKLLEKGSGDIRPLNMADLKSAHQQVSASCPPESQSMEELIQWNDQYGEGGSRKRARFDYFI